MAGEGKRFRDAGFLRAKPFIEIHGRSMIELVLENLSVADARYILICRKDHLAQNRMIVENIKKSRNVVFIPIDQLTEGAVCTVLFARKYINSDEPLLIANSDQFIDMRIQEFIGDCFSRNMDGSILTFVDKERNPKWSFAEVDEMGQVSQVREKVAISDLATVGIYLFSKGRFFVDGAIDMIAANERVNREFYVCPVYNFLIKDEKKIGVFSIHPGKMHGLGTPEDLQKFLSLPEYRP